MKKITETAKELGITFCQDCALYSWDHCDKFNFPADPGDLTCPHFIPIKDFEKLIRELNNIAKGCGFRANFEYISEDQVNVYFTKIMS